MVARRVSRTILFGSAPSVKEQAVRGIEASRIRLGIVQPGENIAIFNDALSTLQNSLTYLYSNPSNDRFWYDTRPTLRKTVEDRIRQIPEPDVNYEIERRLRKVRKEQLFGGLHICPASSLDVPDDQTVRLVIMRPEDAYNALAKNNNDAINSAENILNNRGNSPRIYRNMLAFVAPDQSVLPTLVSEVRRFIAWKSVNDDIDRGLLNIDTAQKHETENNLKRCDQTVELRINEAYSWLMVPYIDRSVNMKTIDWDCMRISGGTDSIVSKASKKMIQNETLITKWAPALLLMELDNVLWNDGHHISIKKLWEYLCSYCYLPRLASYEVLEETICNGINSDEYFALAEGVSDNRYLGLKYDQSVGTVNSYCHLVKIDDAKKQIAEDKKKFELENIRETPLDGPQKNFGSSNSTFKDGTSAMVTSVPVYPDTP